MNGVVEFEGAAEEVKSEQGEDKAAEGVFINSYTERCLFYQFLMMMMMMNSWFLNDMKLFFCRERSARFLAYCIKE